MFAKIFKKEYILWTRYFTNSLGGLITTYFIFLLIFGGYKGFAGPNPSAGSLESIIIGYMLWVFALFTYQTISLMLTQEAVQGTLEQLYMSPFSFIRISLYKLVSAFIIHFFINVVFLFVLMVTTGKYLHIDVLSIMPVLVITLMGVAGIGWILGGLTIIFKKIENYLQIVQFIFIFIIAIPTNKYVFAKFLPLSLGNEILQKIMIDKMSIVKLINMDMLYLIINSFAYFILGICIFKICEGIAMKKGLLAHY